MTSRFTLYFDWALLPAGWGRGVRVTVDGGRIAGIETGVSAEAGVDGGPERHAVGLPGLSNGHSHGFQRAMAGLDGMEGCGGRRRSGPGATRCTGFSTDSARTRSRRSRRRAMSKCSRPGSRGWASSITCTTTRQAGSTPTSPRWRHAVAAAAADTGIALTLLPVFYAHAGFGGAPPAASQRRFICNLDQYERLLAACERATTQLPDAVLGVAPHSLRAVNESELRALTELRPGDPLHLHIAEQTQEVDDCVAWSGRRPVEWLLERFAVDARWSLIHATHVTPEELVRIARSRAVVGLCPITEANLGDGVFPAGEFLARDGVFSIGTDSNVTIDAAGELRLLEYGQRLTRRARNVLAAPGGSSTGRVLFERAQAGGAQSLGVPAVGLVAGGPADLISLDTSAAPFVATQPDQWLDHWIFAARRPMVDCVWRAGRKLVQGGRHIHAERIERRYREVLARLTVLLV